MKVYDSKEETYDIYYTKSMTQDGKYYFTLYKIYNSEGEYTANIQVKHYKEGKTIGIDVRDVSKKDGTLSRIYWDVVEYSTPSLKWFGKDGYLRESRGLKYPCQVELQFVSNKYEHVNLLSVYMAEPKSMFLFFTFPYDRN